MTTDFFSEQHRICKTPSHNKTLRFHCKRPWTRTEMTAPRMVGACVWLQKMDSGLCLLSSPQHNVNNSNSNQPSASCPEGKMVIYAQIPRMDFKWQHHEPCCSYTRRSSVFPCGFRQGKAASGMSSLPHRGCAHRCCLWN